MEARSWGPWAPAPLYWFPVPEPTAIPADLQAALPERYGLLFKIALIVAIVMFALWFFRKKRDEEKPAES